ncbi:hypothetical protein JB92DRAFT_3122114 [Gautieria morchelliformis]|nr:hypothetical protein JB92DRAFT_3122114 [Gautieria morchelliformis]
MFRASPWVSYKPSRHSLPDPDDDALLELSSSPPEQHITQHDMDAPEISTLREEEEETPPPESGVLSFTKFRINTRAPFWGPGGASPASGSALGPPVGSQPADSDEEEEEDQLIDDDEPAIVAESGRGLTTSSPASMITSGSPGQPGSPSKRGASSKVRQRRGAVTGRRGRPGREPPDAAAMMSTFEVAPGDQASATPPQLIPPAPVIVPNPPPPVAGPSTADWTTSTPPKPLRKKPGPKKGTTLGPRGPRKYTSKTAQNAPGTSTPLDDALIDPSTFLVPAPPSIPPTPGPDQLPLPSSHLPPIVPPDLTLDPSIPIPVFPLPTRAFPVQQPPKLPTGYAAPHPIDPKRGPVRKWAIMQREIKGIGGGRWFARTWVAPQSIPQPVTRPSSPRAPADVGNYVALSQQVPPEAGPSRVWAPMSLASSVKAEAGAAQALLELDQVDSTRWPTMVQGPLGAGLSSRGPASPRSRANSSPSAPSPGAIAEVHAGPS